MQQVAISALIIITMCALGLRTPARDFAVVWTRPFPLLLAILVNIVVVPFITVLALSIISFPNAIAVGFLICAASPGGPVGPLFAMQAKGHVATAVTAMVTLSMLSALTAPLTLTWALDRSVAIDTRHLIGPMIGTLVAFQILPFVIGMAVQRFRPALAERLSKPTTQLANGILLLIIVGLFVTKGHVLIELGVRGLVLCASLVLVSLVFGAIVSRRQEELRSYAAVTGVRNTSLALLIGASFFPNPSTDAAILTFALFAMVIPFVAAKLVGARG